MALTMASSNEPSNWVYGALGDDNSDHHNSAEFIVNGSAASPSPVSLSTDADDDFFVERGGCLNSVCPPIRRYSVSNLPRTCDAPFGYLHKFLTSPALGHSSAQPTNPPEDGRCRTVHEAQFRVSSKSHTRKKKSPDISKEIAECREAQSPSLDLSNKGLNQLPHGIFKELSFISELFLYDNKLCSLPSAIGHLSNLRLLLLQQNLLTASGLPSELSKLSRLKELDLRHNRLEGCLPACICNLPNLEHLLLNYNKLTSIEGVTNLTCLTVLVVSRNFIREDLPYAMGELCRLTTLDLSFNLITSVPPSIGNCSALRDFNLQHNRLTRLPSTIGRLVNLRRLAVKYNHLVEIPESICNCTKLDDFNVENNHLSSLPPNFLAHFPNLKNIALSRNRFATLPPGDARQFENCYALHMDHNQITCIPESIFSRASRLTTLNLCDNGIKSLIPADLLHWKSLIELDLGSNHLTGLPAEIKAFENMEILKLNFNQLKALPAEIGSLAKLRILNVESNQLEELPDTLGGLVSLQEFSLLGNLLTTFPKSIGSLPKLKLLNASENDIQSIPPEIGDLPLLENLYLSDNSNLNMLPAELSLCKNLKILTLENCPLSDMPAAIVEGGSAMIIYSLQKVIQLRRQWTTL
ncbi:unnamed protein product [Calicophoron daubneyi]|uniref:Leucine-rich repeat protein soc-2 homolog n=1 Tax=Calicophoron daubneyi TaxID=300641 RepID=A0AAV2TFR9_CALDB